jgi:hypothetical protein
MTMMTKNPIAFAKQMDDFMASVNGRLDAIMAHLGIPAPGAEPDPDQPPSPTEVVPVSATAEPPPVKTFAEVAEAEHESPRAAKKKA